MDDIFGMLHGDLRLERKIVAAITTGMTDSVHHLVEQGGSALMNAVLQQANGRTALHVACQVGHHEYISLFVAAGADPSQPDFFGMTPLDLALRSGHENCVREMLTVSRPADPLVLWTAQTRAGIQAWRSFSTEVISVLIVATPDFGRCFEAVNVMRHEYFQQPEKYEQLIRIFLLTGNKLTAAQSAELQNISNQEFREYIRSFQYSVLSLQHLCRQTIRRNMRSNVLYAAKTLPIPVQMQNYLIFADN